MLLAVTNFAGRFPRFDARQLPPIGAQIALNCDFGAATLAPIRKAKPVHIFASPVLTIFLDGSTWLGFASIVSIARGPIAQDRLYYTGDGVPKMRVGTDTYDLAINAPATAPTVVNDAAPGADIQDVFWAYTWVTGFGEESPPSPLFGPIQLDQAVTQTISGFAATPAGRNITGRRLYRSQTSLTGATELMFVAEIPVATTSFVYDPATMPLAEAITSRDFDPPDSGLQGLTSLPNGMMAAFAGKELFFSEPYQPHAWPRKYSLAVDADIVGITAFGSSLAVLTRGAPYVVQGVTPDTMAMERVENGLPCTSARGIVDFGYSAIYPSPDGLVLIGEGVRKSITASMFNREQWGEMNPSSIIAARYDGNYMMIHNRTSVDLYDCGPHGGWPAPDLEADFDTSGPTLAGAPEDYTVFDFGSPDSSFGEQAMSWINPAREDLGISSSNLDHPTVFYTNLADNGLYFVGEDGVTVYEWGSPSQSPAVVIWRSKIFSSNTPTNAGAIYVKADRDIAGGDTFRVRVFGDNQLVREISKANAIQRLPGGRMYRQFEVEIETNVPVLAAYVAEAPDDIMVALQ